MAVIMKGFFNCSICSDVVLAICVGYGHVLAMELRWLWNCVDYGNVLAMEM